MCCSGFLSWNFSSKRRPYRSHVARDMAVLVRVCNSWFVNSLIWHEDELRLCKSATYLSVWHEYDWPRYLAAFHWRISQPVIFMSKRINKSPFCALLSPNFRSSWMKIVKICSNQMKYLSFYFLWQLSTPTLTNTSNGGFMAIGSLVLRSLHRTFWPVIP